VQDLFRHLRIHTSDKMEIILCERCKIALHKTATDNLYRCPMCYTVTEVKQEDE
tara:strand:- start:1100 stop:1261 length:162 start_codon:yes stop_codon:yes gene_type:complete